jgi:DNA-binding transcriptional regulator YbjK
MTTEQSNTTHDTAQQPTTDGANSGQSNGATFTQAQINEIVGKTRKDARDTAISDVLKELGLTSKDELKSTIEDARKRKEADMSESEKAKAELETERAAKTALEQRIATLETERRNEKLTSALTSKAVSLKANDADDVLRYARDKHAEELTALMDETGQVDDKKLTALLDKIKAAKPAYFTPLATTLGSMSNGGGRPVGQAEQKVDTSKYRL